MKRIETITVKPSKEYTKEIEIFICDFCGKESKNSEYGRVVSCYFCKRHICDGTFSPCVHNEWDGDYRTPYCPICWDLKWRKYAEERSTIESEMDEKLEALDEKIKKESLETPLKK